MQVTLLREDGSGQPYTRPGVDGNRDRYLKLPHAYWSDDWHRELSLPAIAMLLVSLHEERTFQLPTERMPEWYGWSADTAERGFAELIDKGLLAKNTTVVKAPLSPTGLTTVNRYRLVGAFEQPKPKKIKTTATRKAAAKKTTLTSHKKQVASRKKAAT